MNNLSDAQLEHLDLSLESEGVPLRHRPLDCFKKLYGGLPDGPERAKLFEPITEWYLHKYGDQVRWDGVIARFPVLIKGVIYLAQARFGTGEVVMALGESIENLPEGIIQTLSAEEKRALSEKLTFGTWNFTSLYNLRIEDDWLGETERELVRRAVYDLENAAVTLKHTGDTQGTIVQVHQAAEKCLKAALASSGFSRDLKSLGHNVPRVFKELLKTDLRYACLTLPVENLQKLSPNMEMRYTSVPRSLEMASEAYHGALYVCGMIAQMWIFDKARGTSRARFKESRFYVDGTNTTFYCKLVEKDSATLTLFRSSRFLGSHMADLKLDLTQSALYLEVSDPAQDAELRSRFAAHLRSPGRRISPGEIGLRTVHGPEGSYTTAEFKRLIRGSEDPDRPQ